MNFMVKKDELKYHLEIQQHRKKPYGLIRATYRENGKIKHATMCRINDLDLATLQLMQAAMKGAVVRKSEFKILSSKEYGASFALLQIAKQLELDKMIYSRTCEPWVKDCMAMIVGRIVYSGSKLSLSNVSNDSCIWELCGINDAKIDVNIHCYNAMDKLFARQDDIQKKLASKYLEDNCIVLYDITSSYLEGEYSESELVEFGYNRDKKRGFEQIVIGLICSKNGCPIAVEVFKGNTKDESTVQAQIAQIKNTFGVKNAIFIGDRGMITKKQFAKINENDDNYIRTISALRHADIKKLCEHESVQISMFDEMKITEIQLPENPRIRYGLCKNPVRATEDKATRLALIEKTKKELEKISDGAKKRKTNDGKLGTRVGKILNKYHAAKYINMEIINGELIWNINENKVQEDEKLDGFYVIFTDVSEEQMNINEVVESYRKLVKVEQSFRNLKSPHLELRPIYHKTDDRIKCHVFICMLSYYLMWELKNRLQPLFDTENAGKNRKFTTNYILERLKSIRSEKIDFLGATSNVITTCDDEQKNILNLLKINML